MGFDGFPAKPGDIPALDEIRHLKAEIEAEREARAVDEDQIRELLGHVAKLREALEPFAAEFTNTNLIVRNKEKQYVHLQVKQDDLRHARAVLKETNGDGG